MTKIYHQSSIVCVGFLMLVAGNCLVSSTAPAGEFHFIVHDMKGDVAAWSPREVIIHKSTDLDGGLSFVLDNPTPRTHVFEAPGLFEQTIAEGERECDREPDARLRRSRRDGAHPGQCRTVEP